MKNDMNILGIMSGTSLDGIDLSICSFWESGKKWIYRIHASETVPYTDEWIRQLQSAPHLSGIDLLNLHQEYGQYIADHAMRFISSLISSLLTGIPYSINRKPVLPCRQVIRRSLPLLPVSLQPEISERWMYCWADRGHHWSQ